MSSNRFSTIAFPSLVALALLPMCPCFAQEKGPLTESTVGMSGKIEAVVLPGTELEVIPITDHKTPLVLRIVQVYPHGTNFRYDLEYYALEPGSHDLRTYLKRKDGGKLGELPPLVVKVNSVLPPGKLDPHHLEMDSGPRLGGYRLLLIILGTLWSLGLLAIVASFIFPRRKKSTTDTAQPLSLADKLRPLVEGAIAGKLSHTELANLERSLLAYWRKRLGLESKEPSEAMATLRNNPEASPLLKQLEVWLHHPGEPEPIDVGALLAPYRNLSPEAIDLPSTALTKGGSS